MSNKSLLGHELLCLHLRAYYSLNLTPKKPTNPRSPRVAHSSRSSA
jgi:hypothetical protein